MSVAVDPFASIRAWTLDVRVADREYTVEPRSAAEWLTVLLEDPFDAASVLPGMLSEEQAEELEEALLEGRVASQEVMDAALDVVAMAAGRPWWWTIRLMGTVSAHWLMVFGELAARGLDVARMPLGAFLDAAYHVCTSHMGKPEHRQAFDRELEMPPVGTQVELDEEKEAASFLAMMNAGV